MPFQEMAYNNKINNSLLAWNTSSSFRTSGQSACQIISSATQALYILIVLTPRCMIYLRRLFCATRKLSEADTFRTDPILFMRGHKVSKRIQGCALDIPLTPSLHPCFSSDVVLHRFGAPEIKRPSRWGYTHISHMESVRDATRRAASCDRSITLSLSLSCPLFLSVSLSLILSSPPPLSVSIAVSNL